MSQVSSLPVELVIRVLCLLPFKDIVICSGVSRQFRKIIDTTSTLEYILELSLSGLVDSGQGNLAISERLHRLREREHAWSTLSWQSVFKIPVAQKYIYWELCGSLFVGTFLQRNNSSPQGRVFDNIDIFELTESRVVEGPRRIALEKTFYGFSVDPGQDLLILVEKPPPLLKSWTLLFRSLSEGWAHPGTTRPITSLSMAHTSWHSDDGSAGAIDVQILGRMVLFTQRRGPGGSGGITVIDWTTGNEIFLYHPLLGGWVCNLLSETELIVAERASFRSQPSLRLYLLNGPTKWASPRITFHLPFQDASRTWKTAFCYGPASCSYTGLSPTQSSASPFTYRPTPHLLAFRFMPQTDISSHNGRSNATPILDMFLLVDHLQRYMHLGDVVPWEIWGPQSTRIFGDVLSKHCQRNIQGYRAVLPGRGTVLDFNNHLWAEGDDGVVTESSHIRTDSSLGFNVVSSLPYRELRPPQPFNSKYILLGDNVVCVEVLSFLNHRKAF